MNEAMAQFERFLVAIPCIVVISLSILAIVMRMVGGDLPVAAGFGAVGVLIAVMWLCVNPPHPAVPGVALVAVIGLMVSFPFVEKQLEEREQRAYDLSRLERAYAALQQKADNPSAAFEAARWLWVQGFRQDAIAIADRTLTGLDTKRDEIRNTSMREMFRAEEVMLRNWRGQPQLPEPESARVCPACKTRNEPGQLNCSGCGRQYLLDKARLASFKDKVFAKLVLSYVAVCGMAVGGASIGMSLEGAMRWVAIVASVALVGGLLAWLFKPPAAAKTT